MILDWQMSTTQGVPGFSVWVWTSAPTAGAEALGPFCIKAIEFRTGEVVGDLRTGRCDNMELRTGRTEPTQAGCP